MPRLPPVIYRGPSAWDSVGSKRPDRLSRISRRPGELRDSRIASSTSKRPLPSGWKMPGAVLLGKLSLGALAMGDQWFGGMTRSPWDPRRGSSGSSAGSASAAAAGLIGFGIGSETLGSIVSPCRACGASGLRPTYGRVSRHGCMTLSWSMDKLGPIARSIEDCALILDAIHGSDGLDLAAVDQPFAWPPKSGCSRHEDRLHEGGTIRRGSP